MNKKQVRLTESDLKQIVKESVNRIVKESNELDANGWKDYIMRNSSYPRDIKDIENKASWEAFDDDVDSLYGQRGYYDDDYASQAYADEPLSDFYGLENKNTLDFKGYLGKKKLNDLAQNESKNMNKKLIRLTEQDIHFLVEEAVKEYMIQEGFFGGMKNLAQKGTQAMKTGMSNMGKGIANKAQNAYNNAKATATNAYNNVAGAATNAYNNVAGAATNAYNNVKTAYQQGSAQQDIQNVNKALQPMVQKGILGQKQYNTILGMLNKAIEAQGGQRMQGLAQA